MTRGSSNSSIRKALGSIKDTTTISLAKVNSEYKELDIAIVKATNHVERPAKERHIRAIFAAVSAARPRADVAYCIHTISKRLVKTRNWAVALKTLIVIHRALREADPSFHEELINYGRRGGHVLNMSHFKDDSSAYAWDFSAWIRCYALYLEERLECFRVLKYDVETDRPKTKDLDIVDLLQQLPSLQQLLSRAIACQLEGAAANNAVIRLALSLVASESMKIYDAISDGTLNLVEKFFKMQHQDAIRALDIYRRVVQQAERLSLFHEVCMSLNIRGDRFLKIEQPPTSLLQAMEDYVRVAPRGPTFRKEQMIEKKDIPKDILTIEDTKDAESKQDYPTFHAHGEPVEVKKSVAKSLDLLSLDCHAPVVQEQDEKNALALAIVPTSDESTTKTPLPRRDNGIAGWELALVTAPTSNEPPTMPEKLAGGLSKLTLDNLYDEAIRKTSQSAVSCSPWEAAPMANRMMQQQPHHDPFLASRVMAPPPCPQMTTQQQQAFMLQQQQQQQHMMMTHHHPSAMSPYGAGPYGSGMPMHHPYNPYAGMF